MEHKPCQAGTGIKLHLGCETNVVEGWINLDGSWNAWLANYPLIRKVLRSFNIISKKQENIPWERNLFIHDLRKSLPFSSGHIRHIYSSHVLEHLYFDEANSLLTECYRVLEYGGVLRVVVPDLKSIILEYLGENIFQIDDDEDKSVAPAYKLNERLLLRSLSKPKGNIFYKLYAANKDFHSHKFIYDSELLINCFIQAGFKSVDKKDVFDSRIEDIRQIEIPERIQHGVGICVEGVK